MEGKKNSKGGNMKYGIYNHGKLQSIIDTDCEDEVKKIIKILREYSNEKIPSIDYLPLTQEGWQEFEKEGKK